MEFEMPTRGPLTVTINRKKRFIDGYEYICVSNFCGTNLRFGNVTVFDFLKMSKHGRHQGDDDSSLDSRQSIRTRRRRRKHSTDCHCRHRSWRCSSSTSSSLYSSGTASKKDQRRRSKRYKHRRSERSCDIHRERNRTCASPTDLHQKRSRNYSRVQLKRATPIAIDRGCDQQAVNNGFNIDRPVAEEAFVSPKHSYSQRVENTAKTSAKDLRSLKSIVVVAAEKNNQIELTNQMIKEINSQPYIVYRARLPLAMRRSPLPIKYDPEFLELMTISLQTPKARKPLTYGEKVEKLREAESRVAPALKLLFDKRQISKDDYKNILKDIVDICIRIDRLRYSHL
ncbi:hypothetical protein ACOME3_009605 [Neoechinorhynchus agilis]